MEQLFGIEIRVEVRPDKTEEFLQAVETLRSTSGEDEGLVSQTIYQESGQTNRFIWIERWADRHPLESRLRSEPFRVLLGAVRVLGMRNDMELIESKHWTDQAVPIEHATN